MKRQEKPTHNAGDTAVSFPYADTDLLPELNNSPLPDDYGMLNDEQHQSALALAIESALDPCQYMNAPSRLPDWMIDGLSSDVIAGDPDIPDYLLPVQENSTNKALRLRTQHYLKPGETVTPAKGARLHIGIDSEYVYNPATKRNDILSYQFFAMTEKGEHSAIIYPASNRTSDRLSFDKFLGHIVVVCKEKGILTEWPKHVFVYAHFLRADLASFGDFWRFKTQVNGIRRTVASVNNAYGIDLENVLHRQAKPAPLILRDKQRKAQRTLITFVDTMLHTPGGAGLAAVGELIGLPKLSLSYCQMWCMESGGVPV
ncbi:hypothetical protein [Aeromonas caviae]|uniref:hypothetical protein n=1 Tax=Aeromonas caviae TaxID=648 RepID=UPI00191E38F8|nr:hypothetical protein [Aeromonas caviae]MBL0559020.1 hypothetical protein [Aeromonas caviae]